MRLIDADALKIDYGFTWDDITPTHEEMYALIDRQPTVHPKKGKWVEKGVSSEKVIEEWQSCKCSICGRYDTSPYLYYFSEPRFCSWCGADMRGEQNE